MRRRIKFKQWTGECWHYWGFVQDGVFAGPVSINGEYPLSYQLLGLNKDGEEIYDGDVFKPEIPK